MVVFRNGSDEGDGKKITTAYEGKLGKNKVVDFQGLLIGVLVNEANGSERLEAVVVLYEAVEKLNRLLELKGDRLTKNSRSSSCIFSCCNMESVNQKI